MTAATLHIGDVFDVMTSLPDNSVDLVLTSPPFLALRSYLPADHPDKAKEIGSEPTPAEFIDTLLALTAEWDRVLAPHGSICVELGDTYAGSGGAGGDYNADGLRDGQERFDGAARRERNRPRDTRSGRAGTATSETPRPEQPGGDGWPLPKSLTGIPTLYAWSLAYGRNLLTGEESPSGMWRVRNVVAWCRPNPPVGALGDKFRPGTSYITVACKARDRWFDLDAVRTAHAEHSQKYGDAETRARHGNDGYIVPECGDGGRMTHGLNPAGAPPLDWWQVSTEPYSGSHYATWPRKLLGRPIESMCPREVCTACGEPRRRLVDAVRVRTSDGTIDPPRVPPTRDDADGGTTAIGVRHAVESHRTTTGWSDCGCGAPWRRGIVLDPFAGSGTTLAVATGLGRDAIGIDIDERNADLARERVGMFLTVIEPDGAAA